MDAPSPSLPLLHCSTTRACADRLHRLLGTSAYHRHSPKTASLNRFFLRSTHLVEKLSAFHCVYLEPGMADPPQKYNVIFVLGGPGVGKGTQCTKIAQKYDYVHLSAGDLLRKELQKENSVHRSLIETSMKEGKIIPEEITCKLLRQAMDESGKSDFLIDGFPRNENNRKGWEKMMKDIAHIKMVLLFCCSKETCFKRCLSRGKERIDDVSEILEKRYETFNDLTLKTIVEYRKQNLLEEINAEGDMDEVFEAVKKVFEK